jgi:ribose transport system permease protein
MSRPEQRDDDARLTDNALHDRAERRSLTILRPAHDFDWGTFLSRFGLIWAWMIEIVIFSVLKPDLFPTTSTFANIFSSQAVLVILTIAFLPPLIAGELDLSAASVLGLSHIVFGVLNANEGFATWAAAVVAIGVGLGVGFFNAALVVVLGIDSIVATLGMGTLLAGISLGIESLPVAGISDSFSNGVRHSVAGLQVLFYIAVGISIVAWFVLSQTPVGRRLYFVGAGRAVARLSGVRVERLVGGSFVTGGVLAAVAGVLLAGELGSADPTIGPTYLLPALSAAFLGATAITPGRFNVWGAFVAVYFLITGITGLELLGLSGWIPQVFYGGSLVVAVALSKFAGLLGAGRRRRQA